MVQVCLPYHRYQVSRNPHQEASVVAVPVEVRQGQQVYLPLLNYFWRPSRRLDIYGIKPTRFILTWNFYRPQRSCGQGNIFTPVCHSVHRGGSASKHAGIPTPPTSHPPDQAPLQTRPPPGADTPPSRHPTPPHPRPYTPRSRHPPRTIHPPPQKQTPAYGLRAAGTHPTGMHSCWCCDHSACAFDFFVNTQLHLINWHICQPLT